MGSLPIVRRGGHPTYDCLWNQYTIQGGSAHPNQAFVEQPGCAFCLEPTGAAAQHSTSCPVSSSPEQFYRKSDLQKLIDARDVGKLKAIEIAENLNKESLSGKGLQINPRLEALQGFISDKRKDEKWVPISTSYGISQFYVDPNIGEAGFNDFVLFVLEAMSGTSQTLTAGTTVKCDPLYVEINDNFPTLIETIKRTAFTLSPSSPKSDPGVGSKTTPAKTQNTVPISIGIQ